MCDYYLFLFYFKEWATVDEDMPSITAQQSALKQDMRDQGVDINFPSKRQKRKKMTPAALASPPGV